MSEQPCGHRYSFVFYRRYFWRDIWKPWFWKMWGVKRTLWYILTDWYPLKGTNLEAPHD